MLGIISFVGSIIGIILSKTIPEEVKPGEKYFKLLKKIILFLILLLPAYYFKISILFFIIGLIIAYILKKEWLFLGLVLVLSYQIKELNLVIISLIFIYGLPYGTLLKNKLDLVINLILFLLPIILIYNNLYITYNQEIFSFVLGGLLMVVYDRKSN